MGHPRCCEGDSRGISGHPAKPTKKVGHPSRSSLQGMPVHVRPAAPTPPPPPISFFGGFVSGGLGEAGIIRLEWLRVPGYFDGESRFATRALREFGPAW